MGDDRAYMKCLCFLAALVRLDILSMEDDGYYREDTPLNILFSRMNASVEDVHMFDLLVEGTWGNT